VNAGFLLFLIPLAIWFGTIWHVVRTGALAKGRTSQALWILFIFFMPELGIVFYWLTEAPIRRDRPTPARRIVSRSSA
jgi:hypothetical protein